mmetsp:Transcript_9319/g.17787  ORF Transcript_9319/g.17787 Transcript_9319/m.17787 type:complete len:287 (+) Transcript_9319:128-988(+)
MCQSTPNHHCSSARPSTSLSHNQSMNLINHNNHHTLLLGKLVKLISKATDLLCEGWTDEAESLLWQLLSFSLGQLQQQQQQQQQQRSVLACHSASHNTINTSPRNQCTLELSEVPLSGVVVDEDFPMDAPHSWFCLYRNCFAVDYYYHHDNNRTETATAVAVLAADWQVMVATVAYNLAMIHHEDGLFDTNFPRLAKARQLYELAGQHLQHNNNTAVLLSLAVHNNYGHLCSFFADTEGILACREALQGAWASSRHANEFCQYQLQVFGDSLTRARQFLVALAPAA